MHRQLTILIAATAIAAAAAAQSSPAGNAPAAPAQSAGQPSAAPSAQDSGAFKSTQEKNGYALGMEMGAGMKKQGLDLDPASFVKGFNDGYGGGKTLLTDEEARAALKAAQEAYQKQQEAARAAEAEKTKKAGEDFLAANKAKDGVMTLPDGLQYKVLKAGEGKKPTADDTVVCNYRGTFLDGTEFDSSEKQGAPATFAVKGVIKGWTEALQLMPVGSKWQIYLPPQLAYGENGAGGVIPPNATLIFDVELVSIKEAAPAENKPSDEKKPETDGKPQQ